MSVEDHLTDLLQRTSRTFALTIPLLPEPIRRQVGVAYLLFRIADSFEDATRWTVAQRTRALADFIALLESDETDAAARAAAESWTREPPLEHAGYLDLIAATPLVLRWHRELAPAANALIRSHLVRTARGMQRYVVRSDERGVLQLATLVELRDYCYVAAGIVGELLTELYLLGCPELQRASQPLRARSLRFGEGLQLVNILKDASSDATEGRIYLPREIDINDVFSLAHADLIAALEYTELARDARGDLGLVAFNALNARLALATLHALSAEGLGSKLTRNQLSELTTEVMHSVNNGTSLFPEL